MPPWCVSNFLIQSLIIFIFYFNKTFSTNDDQHNHQVLKADVGQDITMSCIFDEDKLEQVSFMRQMTGDILSVGTELFVYQPDIELKQFSSNRLDLKIRSVNLNDSGLYTCMFNDEKLFSFLIEILVAPHFISYYPLEGSISPLENSTLNFSCHAFAIPAVNISWIFKNKLKQSKNVHNGENLYLTSIQSSDSGLYECIASNMYHASISRAFYVTVQYAPHVLILNEKIRTLSHNTVTIQCRICSIPQVEHISWLRDNQVILDMNIDVKIHTIDDQCSESLMKIMDINEHQFGQYECRAENLLGHQSDYIDIQQIPKIRRVKQKNYPDEINRNGRTALFTNKSLKKKKNQTSVAEFNENLLSHSICRRTSWTWWWILCLIIYWICLV
ncbi:hypothetical protein I4U23_003442 [Adineta vaga]|nr:hypothetical protein I4U23_003442 [Adineta vaga]